MKREEKESEGLKERLVNERGISGWNVSGGAERQERFKRKNTKLLCCSSSKMNLMVKTSSDVGGELLKMLAAVLIDCVYQ